MASTDQDAKPKTAQMRQFRTGNLQGAHGGESIPNAAGGVGEAGLVLLYATEYEALPGAWPIRSPCVVGRDDGVDVVLDIQAVSRRHAELVRAGQQWLVRDLRSTNGVLLNGARVQEAVLDDLDEIRIGDAVLKLVTDEASRYAGYRIDGVLVGRAARQCQQGSDLVGGYQMDRIAARVERIAPTELSVVIQGESGTGKEVVARELHRLSGRAGRFHAVNCAAIPGNLLESELFGYKRGAFTGAERDKPGLFRAASGGTLLLDEIGDMPLEAQAKLLRVLQSKEVFPLGATAPERVDARVVCATHRNLAQLLTTQRFREDLFARLNEDQIRLPPLRERKEDILQLVRVFLARLGRPDLRQTFPFMLALTHYHWPFNVRELEACIKRCVALCDGPMLTVDHLPDTVREAMREYGNRPVEEPGPQPLEPAGRVRCPSADELRELLRLHGGNVAAVGRHLGKARMQIHRWLRKHHIDVEEYR